MTPQQAHARMNDAFTDRLMASLSRRKQLEHGSGDETGSKDKQAREAVEGRAAETAMSRYGAWA